MGRPYISPEGEVFDPDEITQKLTALGEEYADLKAAATFLTETAKSVLAMLTIEARDRGDGRSDVACERLARTHPRYEKHLKDMVEASRLAERARVRYDSMKAFIDLKRTQMATERAVAGIR